MAKSYFYKVLSDKDLSKLEDKVVEYLADGYFLCGGIAVLQEKNKPSLFLQAVSYQDELFKNRL